MFRFVSFIALVLFTPVSFSFPGVGRPATPEEIAAWDIDVRPDFKGLPKGSGSVKKGEEVWEAKCGSCHGAFGDSNATFPPIAGGVTKEDIERGRVAALARPEQRTTTMKLSQVSTLWDYINRAMPWNAPKTLSVEEVYAVTAYILSLDRIVADDFVLSDENIAEVQKKLPNRNGLTRKHGLWSVKGEPDVRSSACMRECAVEGRVTSELPENARANHGNLAEQMRLVGPVRGLGLQPASAPQGFSSLLEKSGCAACHAASARLVGPSFAEIAAKYRGDGGAEARLYTKVREGSQGVWGPVPMPPHSHVQENDLRTLVRWILTSQ
jgi:S-disulfanyl-L-cysteine oxidoreductase SoxD